MLEVRKNACTYLVLKLLTESAEFVLDRSPTNYICNAAKIKGTFQESGSFFRWTMLYLN